MTHYKLAITRMVHRIACDYVHKDYQCPETSPDFSESRFLVAWIFGAKWQTIGTWHLCRQHSKLTYRIEVQWMYDDAKENPLCLSNDEQNPVSNSASGAHSHPRGTPA